MSSPQTSITAWEQIAQIIDSGNAEHLEGFLQLIPPGEVSYTLVRLDEPHRTHLLEMVRPELAADLMEHFADEQAADLIEELPAAAAAAIVDEMDSDDQADLLGELNKDDAAAILDQMDPEDAADAQALVAYEAESAGGLMETEYLVFADTSHIEDVIADLRQHVEEYAGYDVRYIYVTDMTDTLLGVVRMRDLLLGRGDQSLTSIMVRKPVKVHTDDSLDDLADLFDHYAFTAMPVVDGEERLLGVIQESAVAEALGEAAEEALLKASGIITGEEFRSMPILRRAARRLAYLVPITGLLLISVLVIAVFEKSVLTKFPAIAIFLPLVAGLCGSAGNQAVAVSLREMAMGLVKPADAWLVLDQGDGGGGDQRHHPRCDSAGDLLGVERQPANGHGGGWGSAPGDVGGPGPRRSHPAAAGARGDRSSHGIRADSHHRGRFL